MDKQKPDHKLVELEPIDMHGPVEVTAALYVLLPDGRPATLNFKMLSGQIPARADIKAALDAMMTPASMEESSIPAGTRLMTKPEFVAHVTKQETGQAMTIPGDQHFVPVQPNIPHGMLVHAIAGVGVPEQLADEYRARGLVERDGVGDYWNNDRLADLPGDVLLAIYERLTQ